MDMGPARNKDDTWVSILLAIPLWTLPPARCFKERDGLPWTSPYTPQTLVVTGLRSNRTAAQVPTRRWGSCSDGRGYWTWARPPCQVTAAVTAVTAAAAAQHWLEPSGAKQMVLEGGKPMLKIKSSSSLVHTMNKWKLGHEQSQSWEGSSHRGPRPERQFCLSWALQAWWRGQGACYSQGQITSEQAFLQV